MLNHRISDAKSALMISEGEFPQVSKGGPIIPLDALSRLFTAETSAPIDVILMFDTLANEHLGGQDGCVETVTSIDTITKCYAI